MSTTGTYGERIDLLREMTGHGEWLKGSVIVDQIYAHYQHEHLEFRHPRGGIAKYLERPLMERYALYLEDYARHVLEDGGRDSMARSMDDLAGDGGVRALAPREFGDLRRSGHAQVHLGERLIHDKPAEVGRLSEEDLRIKSRIRYMALPDRLKGWIWWHVQHHSKPPPRRR